MRKDLGSIVLAAVAVMVLAGPADAQMAHRLKGSLSTNGAALTGAVCEDNLSGFRGEGFTGQKDHTAASNDKGEWNIRDRRSSRHRAGSIAR